MIAYFDSSSIVKWFFDEQYADLARDIRDAKSIAFTSFIAFPEVMSAINRAWRGGQCLKKEMEIIRSEFHRIWPDFKWIKVTESLMYHAGQLVFTYNLKGFDAIHLASALLLMEEGEGVDIFFSCFDKRLNQAAGKEGFLIHERF